MEVNILVDPAFVIGNLDKKIFGQFIEHLGRCIYGGIWVGEDSSIPNIKGFRKDVLEAVKVLKPPLVRWPGGNFSSNYHWEDGIGPKDKRPKRFDMAWGAVDPNQFGTCEFIEWCKLVGTEPYIVVNAGNGTPEEAARWVEFCNMSAESFYASLRKMQGYHEPFKVKLWGIGNELYGEWQVGFCIDGKECARRTIEFINEIKKVDPTIETVAVGSDLDLEWNIDMVKYAGKYFDYLSIHRYVFTDGMSYQDLIEEAFNWERLLYLIYHEINATAKKIGLKKIIKIAFDEWNVWHPEAKPPLLYQVTSIRDAIFTGLVLNSLQRLCQEIALACF
ncbi:MAG: alpha-N-arabinofuranosidase, partial [Nitrososphaerota archaeon]|nr:alpha-N-arabinofuranosidase [Nitrososphaerota archaeon]